MGSLITRGNFLLFASLLMTLVGLALIFVNQLGHLGKISGDLLLGNGGFLFYSPFLIALILSVLLTLLINATVRG